MIHPQLLKSLFTASHAQIKTFVADLGHEDSLRPPAVGGNPSHWVLGHVVVSRCNFLHLLAVPSLWNWPTCKLFIPGSSPTAESAAYLSFARIVADFDQTQTQLLAALTNSTAADLEAVKDGKTIGAHLAEYATHEAYHAGQLDLLRLAPKR